MTHKTHRVALKAETQT